MTKTRQHIQAPQQPGRGVELAYGQNDPIWVVALFTRRDSDGEAMTEGVPVFAAAEIWRRCHQTDDGRHRPVRRPSTERPAEQTLPHARASPTWSTRSTPARAFIPAHLPTWTPAAVGGKVTVISAGWDPGMFSIARLYASAMLPEGETTRSGVRGVSQGHSDAVAASKAWPTRASTPTLSPRRSKPCATAKTAA